MTIFFNAKQEPVEKPPNEKFFWRLSVYPIVFNDDGKLLMILSSFSSKYEFPGGGIELEESIEEGAMRECYEETGYRVKLNSMSPIYSGEQYFWGHVSKKFYHSVHLFYEAHLLTEKQDVEEINAHGVKETEKVEWMMPESLNEKKCHAIHLPAIKYLLDRRGRYVV